MAINIIKKTSTKHTKACSKRVPTYLVIHYTAGVKSVGGTAQNVAKMFATSDRDASADFIVDDRDIVQYNPDPTTRYTYAVGGSKYSSISTSVGGRLYNICKNSNSISIEMCSNKKNTKTLNATDTDWYISDATRKNAIELARHLMQLYNIPIERVIMHHEVTGKICPNPFCVNESRLTEWNKFKNDILNDVPTTIPTPVVEEKKETTSSTSFKVKVLVDELNVRNEPSILGAKKVAIHKGEVYTIVKTKGNWGLLKSYASNENGWINISSKYVEKV